MIDTVRFEQKREFKRPLTWKTENIDKGLSDLRVSSKNGITIEVEVSLPKLLFRTNQKLISTQTEIDKALAKADTIIERVAKPSIEPRTFSRVDLVWHFEAYPPEYFFIAHEHCSLPEMRTRVFTYREAARITGIEWQGGKTMTLKMYNKTNTHFKLPVKVVRAEVMLRWDRLRKKLSGYKKVPLTKLDLNSCYKCYRDVLLQLHPKPVPVIKGKDMALCYAEKKGLKVFNLITPSMSNGRVKSLRNKFAHYLLKEFRIDWNKLLPAHNLPPKINAGKLKLKFPKKGRFRLKTKKKSKVSDLKTKKRLSPLP